MVLNIRHSVLTASGGGGGGPGLDEPPPGAGVTGLSRTTYSGANPITTNGTTVSRKNINTTLVITADNVTISDCMIDASGDNWGIDADSVDGLTVDHCTIFGDGTGNASILTGNNWEVTNCDLYGLENGMQCQGGTGLCTGNYIHDLGPAGDAGEAHIDGIQIAGAADGIVISGNWVESWDTSCVFIKADFGDINDVTVDGNTLIRDTDHESLSSTVYSYSVGSNLATNISFTNNRMGKRVGGSYLLTDNSTPTFTGNVDFTTGNPI